MARVLIVGAGAAGLMAAGAAVRQGHQVTVLEHTDKPGQKLGTVGTVGCECAEESHIHVEVKQGEAYLDPAKLPE